MPSFTGQYASFLRTVQYWTAALNNEFLFSWILKRHYQMNDVEKSIALRHIDISGSLKKLTSMVKNYSNSPLKFRDGGTFF